MSELLDIFREEVEINLKEATRLALELERGDEDAGPDRALIEALMRVFHTLKGAARAIGFEAEKEVAHRLEDVYHDLLEEQGTYAPDLVDLSLQAVDLFKGCIEARVSQQPLPSVEPLLRAVDAHMNRSSPVPSAAEVAAAADDSAVQSAPMQATEIPLAASAGADAAARPVEDDVAGELDILAIFRAEVADHLAQGRELIAALEPDATGPCEQLDGLRRVFHTIKGAARAIGCDDVRAPAGLLEALLREDAQLPAPIDALAACALDWIDATLVALAADLAPPSIEPLREQVTRYQQGLPLGPCEVSIAPASEDDRLESEQGPGAHTGTAPVGDDAAPLSGSDGGEQTGDDGVGSAGSELSAESSAGLGGLPRTKGQAAIPGLSDDVPVSATPSSTSPVSDVGHRQRASIAYTQLDRLYRLSGEFTVSVAALAGQRGQVRALVREVSQVQQQLQRLGAQIQADGVGREALQEGLRAALERLGGVGGGLEGLTSVHDRMEGRLRNLADDLSDEVTQARLVPLSELLDDYPRMLRDLAHELGKRVEPRIDGADNRIDRAVLERLRDPLRHLVRNALGHGIENAQERRRLGKSEVGLMVIEARQLGSMMRIRVADDGAGIDMERLRATVIAHGHTTATLWDAMGLEEQMQFLFLPGLSTASEVSSTSGRGFGLDIVKNAIDASGGHIGVHSERHQGTCFELQVPLMLSLTRCLLVRGGCHRLFGAQRYAFPMQEVAGVRRIDSGRLREVEGRLAVHLDDEMLMLYELHQLLGLAPLHQDIGRKHLLVLGEGGHRYGLLVDEVIDEQDMVSRPLDERLGKVQDISGLTLLDDGGVALIIDVSDLLARMDEGSGRLDRLDAGAASVAEPELIEASQILVVEDSVTVREVERHFLEQAGYQVATAVNGVDGLNKAKAGRFDLLITDIDMPRMNGIELITTLRELDRFKSLPIIVVSYKDRPEDRDKTLEAGADRYVTKSEFDTDAMLDLVAELLATPPIR